MAVSYEKNKAHIYKWTAKNKARQNELCRISMAKAYVFKKEVMRLLKINI